jgi:diguanylate cyclase (GGDEF)-like protein/PAS domain S-box-containing protein
MLRIDENKQGQKRRKRFERLSQRLGRITSKDAPPAPEKQLLAARAAHVQRHAATALLVNLVAGLAAIAVLNSAKIGQIPTLSWATLLVLSLGFFYFVLRGYKEAAAGDGLGLWLKRIILAYCAVGVIWAITVVHLFKVSDPRPLVVVFLLAATAASAVAAAAAHRGAALAFAVPVLLALGVYFLRGPTLVEWVLAGLALAHVALVLWTVSVIEPAFAERANLEDKNRQLVEALEYAVAETREREDENRIIAEAGHSWEAWYGADGKLRWLNRGVERITGYTVEECMGQRNHPFDIVFPEDREDVLRVLASAAKQQKIDYFEFRVVHKDGGIRACAMTSVLVSDSKDRGAGFRVSIWDISDRKALEEQVEVSVATDALTGLINRSQFFNFAHDEIYRATRHDRPVAVALIDIDWFRSLNDQHGNDIGDECLKVLARVVCESIRPTDFFARYGGEEFALLMPETQIGEALRLCERLRQLIEQQRIALPGNAGTVAFTVSVGLADLQSEGEGVDQLIARSDAALRRAKENGRNQVAYGDPGILAPAPAQPSGARPLFGKAPAGSAPARPAPPPTVGGAEANPQSYSGGVQKARFVLPKR